MNDSSDAPVTRPDLDALIAKMKLYAELEDMVGFIIRSTDWLEAAAALAAERARADQAERQVSALTYLALSPKRWSEEREREVAFVLSAAPTAEHP